MGRKAPNQLSTLGFSEAHTFPTVILSRLCSAHVPAAGRRELAPPIPRSLGESRTTAPGSRALLFGARLALGIRRM